MASNDPTSGLAVSTVDREYFVLEKILLYLIFVADDPCHIRLYRQMSNFFFLFSWLVLTTKILITKSPDLRYIKF